VLFEILSATITNVAMITTTEAPYSSSASLIQKSVKGVNSPYIILILCGAKDSDEHNVAVMHLSTLYLRTRNTKYAPDDDIIPDKKGSSPSSYRDNTNTKKFVHSSIRVEEHVVLALQKEAQRRGTSFNNLVNNTLKNYVTSEMYFEQLGFILVSKDFLRRIFLKLDEKYVEEFGREIGLTVAKEYISYFSAQVNKNTLIQFLDIWFRRFQFCQHRIEIDKHIADDDKQQQKEPQEDQQLHLFIVIHDINMNFSLVLRAILEALIEPITKTPVIFRDVTSTSITFSIKI
jgi:hypothetical protein